MDERLISKSRSNSVLFAAESVLGRLCSSESRFIYGSLESLTLHQAHGALNCELSAGDASRRHVVHRRDGGRSPSAFPVKHDNDDQMEGSEPRTVLFLR